MNDLLEILLSTSDSPLSASDGVAMLVKQYKPLIYAICHEGLELYKDLVDTDEYFLVRAKYDKKMLDAFINEGFSREEAIDLMLAQKVSTRNAVQGSSGSIKK